MAEHVRDLADRLLAEAPVGARRTLSFGSCVIELESNSPELVDRLGEYFGGFLDERAPERAHFVVRAHQVPEPDLGIDFVKWTREPGKATDKEAFRDLADGRVVRKVRTGMQFLVSDKLRVAFGDCLANPNQVVNFVNFQLTSWLMNTGHVLCHAAGVVADGRGLGLAAFSGGGKSSLALELMSRSSVAFCSNDRLLVRRDGERTTMVGVPKHPRINPGTALANPDLHPVLSAERRAELSKLSRAELWPLEEKYDARIDTLYGPGRIALQAPLHGLLLLGWKHTDPGPARFARIELAARHDWLEAVVKSPGPFHWPTHGRRLQGYEPPDPGPYLDALARVPVYTAEGGVDSDAARGLCDALLRGEEPALD